jgi:hypothetical protein
VARTGQGEAPAKPLQEQWRDEIEWAVYDVQQVDWSTWFKREGPKATAKRV